MKKFVSKSVEDTEKIAKEWLSEAYPPRVGLGGAAHVVGLSGHLGAGKTAFVKCVAKLLGIKEVVTSPTFVIMKIYDIDQKVTENNLGKQIPWKRLVHIDAYRLEKQEELQAIRFENIVSDPNNLVLIEWPENVSIKNDYTNIAFQTLEGEEGRSVEVN